MILLLASEAFARRGRGSNVSERIQSQRRMVYMAGDGGMSTYKSKMVEQNDTGTVVSYMLGGTVGEEKNLEFRVRTDTSTINFELNTSSIQSQWQDTLIVYRWGFFYLGAGLGTNALIVKKDGTQLIDVVGSGFGGNVGFFIPVTNTAILQIDAVSMSMSQARELQQTEVSFGPRTDIDLRVNYAVWRKYMDLIYGYRYRTYSTTISGTSYAELHTSTYLGLQFGFDL